MNRIKFCKTAFFLLLFIIFFSGTVFCETNRQNFSGSESFARIDGFIYTMLKNGDFFTNFSYFIATNGLILDDTYNYLMNNLITNSNFINSIRETQYSEVTNFFYDFKEFFKTYSYYIFFQLLNGNPEDAYIQKLDILLKKYRNKRKEITNNNAEIKEIDKGINSFVLLKKRIEEYKILKVHIDQASLNAVKSRENELTVIYQKLINPEKGS